jgi:hypothetical protein
MKTKPKNLWKYISKFRENYQVFAQLKIAENKITQAQCTLLLKPWIIFLPSSVVILNNARFMLSDFLNIPSVSVSDVKQAVRCFSPSKYVGPDEIPSSIIKDCS